MFKFIPLHKQLAFGGFALLAVVLSCGRKDSSSAPASDKQVVEITFHSKILNADIRMFRWRMAIIRFIMDASHSFMMQP